MPSIALRRVEPGKGPAQGGKTVRNLNSVEKGLMSREHLATYLNDHLSGSVTALEILDHLKEETADIDPFLARLEKDIKADRQQLVDLMAKLDIPQSRIRKASGWLAERFVEAKLEVDDQSGGRLRRLERLEALALGIDGKLGLWKSLEAASSVNDRLRGPDYGLLAQRAREQRARVEALRIEAARSALRLAA